MSKNTEGKATKKDVPGYPLEPVAAKKDWSISLGTYPGIVIGARTYHGDTHHQHVFYLPFIDIAIEIEN